MTGSVSGAAWRCTAACRGLGPTLFYDPTPTAITAAKRICAGCPVAVECAAYAVAGREAFGVWGGRSEFERRSGLVSKPSGPQPLVSDEALAAAFSLADPARPAIDVVRLAFGPRPAAARKYLARAAALGLVERRCRGWFPASPSRR